MSVRATATDQPVPANGDSSRDADTEHRLPQRQLERRLIAALAVLLLGVLVTIAAGLAVVLHNKQTAEAGHQRKAVRAGLSVLATSLGRETDGVGIWDEAVALLHNRFDRAWATTNVTTWFHDLYDHSVSAVIGPDGQILLAQIDGTILDEAAQSRLQRDAAAMVATLRGQPATRESRVSGVYAMNGRAALCTARPVVPDMGSVRPRPGPATILLGCVDVANTVAPTLSTLYGMKTLAVAPLPSGAAVLPERALSLRDHLEQPTFSLEWRDGTGIGALIDGLWPILAAAIGGIALIGTIIVVKTRELIAQISAARWQAERTARHDALTGLPNRHWLQQRLGDALDRALAAGSGLDLLYIDLDGFKDLNDTVGHGVGDDVLREVARRLVQAAGSDGLVGRLGSDEFVLAVPAPEPGSDLLRAEALDASLRAPIRVGTHTFSVCGAIGIARAPEHGTTPDALLRRADIAMYAAKRDGSSGPQLFALAMEQDLLERRALERDLREALRQEQLHLCYQPILDARGRTMVGAEALVRWTRADGQVVPPCRFVPIAEATGQIEALGWYVLRTACRAARDWDGLSISVNVSPLQIRKADFVQCVLAILTETGLPPARLTLEITEGVLIHDPDAVIAAISQLRTAGVRFALDDFGTGFSSLSYLRQLPCDAVKIDKSFVRAVTDGQRTAAVIASLVSVGHALGMAVVAEGIETEAEFALLKAAGCDFMQGYLFARPLEQAAFEASWLQRRAGASGTAAPQQHQA